MATPERVALGMHRVDVVRFSNAVSVLCSNRPMGSAGRYQHEEQRGAHPGGTGHTPRGTGGLRRVYLTHHYSDYGGGLPGVRRWAPSAEVMASEHEVEIISGQRRPDLSSNAMFRFVNQFQRLHTAPVGRAPRGDNKVTAGFCIVLTPVHTLGRTPLLRN